MLNARGRKALLCATVALLICSIPLGARLWLEKNGALERPHLGVVGEFVMRDEGDRALTRDQLRRSVTLMVYWPKDCSGPGSCSEARKNVLDLANWVEQSLEAKWTEEKNPLNLLVVGEGGLSLSLGGKWRRFPGVLEPNTLLPGSANPSEPWLVVVDNILQFAALENLGQQTDLKGLERVLSKTAFDQYLGNYLSRRTFLGPKRTPN